MHSSFSTKKVNLFQRKMARGSLKSAGIGISFLSPMKKLVLFPGTMVPSDTILMKSWITGGYSRMQFGKKDLKSSLTASTVQEARSEEHTSELQSRGHLVCRLLLAKKKRTKL